MARPVRAAARRRRLPVEWVLDPPRTGARHRLAQVFGRADLVILGLGVTIGGGIFSLAGQQAAGTAGPAVLLSFLVAALVCALSALSYAELSSMLPSAGSAYTFSYVAFGEAWAWVVGWAFLLEMMLATAVIAHVWADYALATLADFGHELPAVLARYAGSEASFNALALVVMVLLACLVVIGGRLSVRVLWVAVVAKVGILLVIIAAGAAYFDGKNYTPFIPDTVSRDIAGGDPTVLQALGLGVSEVFGITGVFVAVPVIVFAFLGFDILATAAEETRTPQRDVPSAVLRTLLATTVLYLAVAVVLIGMRPYSELGSTAPVSAAFRSAGADMIAQVVNPGALLGLTTALMVLLIGQTRLVMSMARDGMLPESLSRVSRRFRSPARATAVVTVAAACLSLAPVLALAELVSMGSLVAFISVSIAVVALRKRRPDLPRAFRVPLVPAVPLLAIASTLWVMLHLRVEAWMYFGIWTVAGLLCYVVYGRRRSRVARLLTPRRGRHTSAGVVAESYRRG